MTQNSSKPPELPPGFRSVDQIKSLPGRPLVNFIGFLKDYRQPMKPFSGSDFKCTLELKDSYDQSIDLVIFWPEKSMPRQPSSAGCAVLLRNVKVQSYRGQTSLLANKTCQAAELHILSEPNEPGITSDKNPWTSYNIVASPCRPPSTAETGYVLSALRKATHLDLPDTQEFMEKSRQSINIKEKFKLLEDVQAGKFVDLLGEVRRVYDGSFDHVTVYLSDYTANNAFYRYVWPGKERKRLKSHDMEADEFGDISTNTTNHDRDWPGPFGKMSIQITLFDESANVVREEVKVGNWIYLKNVHIAHARMGDSIEGKVHGDGGRVLIEVLRKSELEGKTDELSENGARWKAALYRKIEYEKKQEKQAKQLEEEQKREADGDQMTGEKRKRADAKTLVEDKKGKRKRQRRKERETIENLDLNPNIRCSHLDRPCLPLGKILEPMSLSFDKTAGDKLILPFVNQNYRANVKIVDYFPSKVQDFAVGRRNTEYDMLSNYSGGDESDLEWDSQSPTNGRDVEWEWRFAFEVEDAGSKLPKDRMWLMVNNPEAQALLNEDAANLRTDPDLLERAKQKLCVFWGDLEEQKSALLPQASQESLASSSGEQGSFMNVGRQPSLDSDDEGYTSPQKPAASMPNKSVRTGHTLADGSINGAYQVIARNKAFTCCIRQYGVKVKEDNSDLANAGDGMRWQRKFGLFGVVI